ncbi:MAG: hypothetical protein C0168_01630 [Candidatus Aminicenantes bacterium]|nr:MAG: hypothetical protein C0168_01630 [Candidatus Aminicenantes bacterium]
MHLSHGWFLLTTVRFFNLWMKLLWNLPDRHAGFTRHRLAFNLAIAQTASGGKSYLTSRLK